MEVPKLSPLLKVDDSFASYKELRAAVEEYEKVKGVQFWTRDAKRLHRASPNVYNIVKHHPELEYCTLKLSCIHGGKAFVKKKDLFMKTFRKNRGTWKQDCKAEIFVKLNNEKNRLVISRLKEEHNHEIPSSEIYNKLPKLRRLAEKRRNTKSELFQTKFQQKLQEIEGVCLDNVVKANSLSRSKNFEKISDVLKNEYQCTVDLQQDEAGKIFGLFFQDEYMKMCFKLFPEILLVDGSYKLHNIRCCIYTLSVENSIGSNCVVGAGVLTVEDKESVDWLLERFKERNPTWPNTTIVITDRKSSEYEVPSHFANATTLICSSHAAYTLRKDLSQLKSQNVTSREAEQCLATFLQLTQAESEEQYTTILEDMDDNLSYPLTEYFYKNWHGFRLLWVKGLSEIRAHIESKLGDPNSRFRSTIGACKTLRMFIDKFFTALSYQRTDTKRKYQKIAVKVFEEPENEAQELYSKVLTPFGYDKIKHYLVEVRKRKSKFKFAINDGDVICRTKTPKGPQFVVSEYSCMCDFFTRLQLPCEHLLKYRQIRKLSLYSKCLFSQRWTRKHAQPLFDIATPQQNEERTSEEKLTQVEGVCLELAALCSEVNEAEFRERMELLLQLKRSWENQDKMVLETAEFAREASGNLVCQNCGNWDEDDEQ